MDLAELARQIAEFQQAHGMLPNAVIVDENPERYRTLMGLVVIVAETAPKPVRVAFVQDL